MSNSYIPERDAHGVMEFGPASTLWDIIDVAMIRPERKQWIDPKQGRNLHLCYGNKKVEGFHHLDYPEWDAEGADGNLPYEDESWDSVMILHSLDHLSVEAVINTLQEVQRVLRPGGVFTNVVPHYMSTLAEECIEHKTRYAIKTWRNIFNNPAYSPVQNKGFGWQLKIGANFVFGLEERNLVLVTQLIKEGA